MDGLEKWRILRPHIEDYNALTTLAQDDSLVFGLGRHMCLIAETLIRRTAFCRQRVQAPTGYTRLTPATAPHLLCARLASGILVTIVRPASEMTPGVGRIYSGTVSWHGALPKALAFDR